MIKLFAAILFSSIAIAGANELHPVSFSLQALEAKSVFVAGDFNGWSTNALPMKRAQDGRWWVNARLAAGAYNYKFIKDGNWILDPANEARGTNGQMQTSRVMVPQPMPGQPVSVAAKPIIPWDSAAVQRASEKYHASVAAYAKYVQSRKDPAELKQIANDLHECAAVFEKYQESAPRGSNCALLLTRCNKLIFDVHATMQIRQ